MSPCAESPACPPNSPTSPRSSTGGCNWSGSSWSASGPPDRRPTPRRRCASCRCSPRPRARWSWTRSCSGASNPDAATYIGSGKVAELAEVVEATGADTVICDGELSPGQLRNLEERLKVKVVDRTALILDIFAQHARSKEGKAQVELAQLNYLVPRLRGWGVALSRQRGGRVAAGAGIGSRGPGETKLEIDRRRIHKRIAQLRARAGRHGAGARDQAVEPAGQRGAGGRHRRVHQRRQVLAAQPADRCRRAGRGRPVRHPRSRPPDGPGPRTAGCSP